MARFVQISPYSTLLFCYPSSSNFMGFSYDYGINKNLTMDARSSVSPFFDKYNSNHCLCMSAVKFVCMLIASTVFFIEVYWFKPCSIFI